MNSKRLNLIAVLAVAATLWGCKTDTPPEPAAPAPATVKSFTASAPTVEAGTAVTLSWTTSDAQSVQIATLSGAPVELHGAGAASGSVDVTVDESTVYVLSARGEGGSDTAAVSVLVGTQSEELLFASFPAKISAGEPVTLVWNAPGQLPLTITDSTGATVYAPVVDHGSTVIYPNASTTFTLTGGARSVDSALVVNPNILAFSSAEPSAQPGGAVTLQWKAGGATSVELSVEGRGVLTTVTDPAQIADGGFVDTVPATVLPRNGLLRYTLVARSPEGAFSRELTVYAGVDPLVTSFKVPKYGKQGAVFSVSWVTSEADQVEILLDGVSLYATTTAAAARAGVATLPTPTTSGEVTLIATNARGGRATRAASVEAVDTTSLVSFAASTGLIANGGDVVTLSWNVLNARHVWVADDAGKVLMERFGNQVETGSIEVYPNRLTTYTFGADNTVGDSIAPQMAEVDVTTPAKLLFSAPLVPEGATVDITGSTVQGGGTIRASNFAVKNAPGTAFVDISATGHALPVVANMDDVHVHATFPAPFSTRIMGVPVTASGVSISMNGWLVFSDDLVVNTGRPTSLPSTALEPLAIAAFSDDLETGEDTQLHWQIDGTGDQQRLIVQWTRISEFPYDQSTPKWLTFQAQVYATGEVVIAFEDIVGYTASYDYGAIGLVNADETGAVAVTSDQFADGKHPSPGDTYSFYRQIPCPVTVLPGKTFTVTQEVGAGEIEIEGAPDLIPPDLFAISEVNVNPAAGVVDGQWIELVNKTTSPFDLTGWAIGDGNGGGFVIDQPVVIPASGRVVLAQSASAGDGVTVDYVWGNGFSLPSTPGAAINVTYAGGLYTSLTVPAFGTVMPGYSVQVGSLTTDPSLIKVSGTTELTCTARRASTYGTSGQFGTPGQPNTGCPAYGYAGLTSPGGFEPIASTGTQVIPSGDADESIDEIQLPAPVRFAGSTFDKIWVGTNGFITFFPLECSSSTNCYYSNSTVLSATRAYRGMVAPFWESLSANPGGGIWWERKVPGIVPNDGYTIVSWENVKYDSTTVTSDFNFQVKFFDNGDIEYHFGTMTSSTASYAKGTYATTWLEDPSGLVAYKVNTGSTPGIAPNAAYRFVLQ